MKTIIVLRRLATKLIYLQTLDELVNQGKPDFATGVTWVKIEQRLLVPLLSVEPFIDDAIAKLEAFAHSLGLDVDFTRLV